MEFGKLQCCTTYQKCLQFVVLVLGCTSCVVGGWGGDYLDSGESVCDDVVLSRDVSNVGSELGNEI